MIIVDVIAFFSEPAVDFSPDVAGLSLAFFRFAYPALVCIAFASLSVFFSSLNRPSWLPTAICVLGVFCSREGGLGARVWGGDKARCGFAVSSNPEIFGCKGCKIGFLVFQVART